jgi:membrane protein
MVFVEKLQKRIFKFIWINDTQTLPAWKQKLVQALRIAYLVIRDLIEGELTLRAMGLVYTTLLSLVPFIAISFSVLKGFGVQNQIEPMLMNFLAPLGDKGVEVSERIIGFVNNMKVGVLGSVGLVLLVYTAVSLLQKIERSFNYTWRVSEGRSVIQRFSQYLSVILIGPVLVFTALGITASITSYSLIQNLMQIHAIGDIIESFSRIVPYMLVIVAFTFVYMLIPNTKVYFKSALVGGLVAGVLWESAGWIFASFVVNSTKYMAIYTVFASLIFFMIWLYVSWMILLIGCSISFYHQNPEQRRLQARVAQLSNRVREKLAIAIMALIGTVYYQKQAPYNARQLAGRLGIGSEACDKVIKDLLEAKLLLKTADEPPALIPAYSLERMLVQDAVNAVRVSGESRGLNPLAMMSPAAAQQAFERLEDGVQDSLQGLSVKDLISQNDNSQDHDHDHDQSVAGQEQSSGPEDANVRKLTNS